MSPRAIVVGAGGLGTSIASALAAAGVAVDIYDADVVELSNLPRQVAYRTADIGHGKADVLAERINARRPPASGAGPIARAHAARFDAATAAAMDHHVDVVIDGSDDPATKFWLADWALARGVPCVIASAIGTTGHVVASGPDGACYRCIFEAPPVDAPTCGDDGVLAPTVAVIGGHAAEVAVATCAGQRTGQLWVFDDIRTATRRVLTPARRPDCPSHSSPRPGSKGQVPMATVRIPAPLRKLTDGKDQVTAAGATVGAVLADLDRQHAGLRARLFDDAGHVKKFINLFVGDEDIRFLQQLDTPINDSDELSIVPAIAGG